MNPSRRRFLKSTGLGFLAGLPPAFLIRAAEAQQVGKGRVMVVVFQRGAMDGLNAVIPFKDPAYYSLRPSIAIPEPASGEDRALLTSTASTDFTRRWRRSRVSTTKAT